jgi:hypothetical protein
LLFHVTVIYIAFKYFPDKPIYVFHVKDRLGKKVSFFLVLKLPVMAIRYLISAFILMSSMTIFGQQHKRTDCLILYTDTVNNEVGYKNREGLIVIAPGKYLNCFSDTFTAYAIVIKDSSGMVAINRQEKVLYHVFNFDNGPDYPSDGLFRIMDNGKIGYADAVTGKVVVAPQFEGAWPFYRGVAKVSNDCQERKEGEHTVWVSNSWYYIDKTGKRTKEVK